MNNHEIMEAIKSDDDQLAVKKVYHFVWSKIRESLGKLVKDDDLLEDLYHDAFILFRQKVKFGGLDCKNSVGYIYKIMRHAWLRKLKDETKKGGSSPIEEALLSVIEMDDEADDLEETEAEKTPGAILRQRLLDGINALHDPYKEMLLQLFFTKPPVPLKEVKILKKDSNTAYRNYEDLKKIKQRAIAKLSQLLK
jgi:DNA-directed RNA polymerase specialized sigma24 family protein